MENCLKNSLITLIFLSLSIVLAVANSKYRFHGHGDLFEYLSYGAALGLLPMAIRDMNIYNKTKKGLGLVIRDFVLIFLFMGLPGFLVVA